MMDYRLEVITLPVSDVDAAVRFYTERAGFTLDVDYRPNSRFRVIQLTPPGSSCSVQFGVGLSDATDRLTFKLILNTILKGGDSIPIARSLVFRCCAKALQSEF